MLATGYTLSEKTTLPFDEAVERVRSELKAEGFELAPIAADVSRRLAAVVARAVAARRS